MMFGFQIKIAYLGASYLSSEKMESWSEGKRLERALSFHSALSPATATAGGAGEDSGFESAEETFSGGRVQKGQLICFPNRFS